jgi:hypothetical protein
MNNDPAGQRGAAVNNHGDGARITALLKQLTSR